MSKMMVKPSVLRVSLPMKEPVPRAGSKTKLGASIVPYRTSWVAAATDPASMKATGITIRVFIGEFLGKARAVALGLIWLIRER
jgi:hypothetical protein